MKITYVMHIADARENQHAKSRLLNSKRMRMEKFILRGKAKVGIQNLLYYIANNIGKIVTSEKLRPFSTVLLYDVLRLSIFIK